MVDISVESLIKIYYNISLMIDIKNDIYYDIITKGMDNSPVTEMETNLIASDLEQLEMCKKSLESLLGSRLSANSMSLETASQEKINNLIMLDPYYILTNDLKSNIISDKTQLSWGLFESTDEKKYIN